MVLLPGPAVVMVDMLTGTIVPVAEMGVLFQHSDLSATLIVLVPVVGLTGAPEMLSNGQIVIGAPTRDWVRSRSFGIDPDPV